MAKRSLICLLVAIEVILVIQTTSAKPYISRRSRVRRSEISLNESKDALNSLTSNGAPLVPQSEKPTGNLLKKDDDAPVITESSSGERLNKNHRNKHKRLGHEHGHQHKRKLHSHRLRNKKHRANHHNHDRSHHRSSDVGKSTPDVLSASSNISPVQSESQNGEEKSKRHHHRQHRKKLHKRLHHRRRRLHQHKQTTSGPTEQKGE